MLSIQIIWMKAQGNLFFSPTVLKLKDKEHPTSKLLLSKIRFLV